jgi:RNA polymerase sigma factor (TIGR02999 family)
MPEAKMDVLYPQLRKIAAGLLRRERPDHTWSPTALVHEAYMRALRALPLDRAMEERHLCILAAKAMRNALVDYARARLARKRVQTVAPGQNEPIRLDEMIHLHLALEELSELDPVASEIVQLRYFLGYSLDETAELVGLPVYDVRKEWDTARLWLLRRLRG